MIEVAPGSPAERAGLRPTDTVVAADGAPVEDAGDLQRLMGSEAIGQTVHLRVLRGDQVIEVPIVPAELG